MSGEERGGFTVLVCGDERGRTGGDDTSAFVARSGPDVDDPNRWRQ